MTSIALDLRFSLFGIPVQVSPWFWVMGVFVGYGTIQLGLEFLLVWVAAVFLSILVHELGHAAVARSFGYSPSILLYQLGGLASYQADQRHTTGRSIAISLAGPAAGFLLLAAIWSFRELLLPHVALAAPGGRADLVRFAAVQMIWINLWWGLLNLVPAWPLDGGQISRELFLRYRPRGGARLAYRVGAVVGAALAVWLFARGQLYAAVLFGFLAAYNASLSRSP